MSSFKAKMHQIRFRWSPSLNRSTSAPSAFDVITVNALYRLLTYLLTWYY